jgi:hypothetical protein
MAEGGRQKKERVMGGMEGKEPTDFVKVLHERIEHLGVVLIRIGDREDLHRAKRGKGVSRRRSSSEARKGSWRTDGLVERTKRSPIRTSHRLYQLRSTKGVNEGGEEKRSSHVIRRERSEGDLGRRRDVLLGLDLQRNSRDGRVGRCGSCCSCGHCEKRRCRREDGR